MSNRIYYWYRDTVDVSLYPGTNRVYVHLKKRNANGQEKSVSISAEAFRSLMDKRQEILEIIEDIEMTGATNDEDANDMDQEVAREMLPREMPPVERRNSPRRFQPYRREEMQPRRNGPPYRPRSPDYPPPKYLPGQAAVPLPVAAAVAPPRAVQPPLPPRPTPLRPMLFSNNNNNNMGQPKAGGVYLTAHPRAAHLGAAHLGAAHLGAAHHTSAPASYVVTTVAPSVGVDSTASSTMPTNTAAAIEAATAAAAAAAAVAASAVTSAVSNAYYDNDVEDIRVVVPANYLSRTVDC